MLRSANDLTRTEINNLVRDCFNHEGKWSNRGFVPVTNEIDFERIEQECLAKEHLRNIEVQIDEAKFEPQLIGAAHRFAMSQGIDLGAATEDRLREIVEGVARALIEADKQFLSRLSDRLTDYEPSDPLFLASPRNVEGGVGLTVNELIDEYCRCKKAEWTPKTLATHRPKLKLLADFLGGDRRADSVTRAELLPYPEAISRLRRNYSASVSRTFQSHQTASETGRIMPSTAATILARATALFRWAFEKGYISLNPAVGLTITEPKKKKGQKSRRPFTADELIALFSAPLFTGCRSRTRRYQAGDVVFRDEYYYLPILAFYTGARLGELVQMHFEDCNVEGAAPFISINEDGPEQPGQADFKHVKSEAGVRVVPLHPDLEDLGFFDFVRRQKKAAGKRKRLFFGIKYGADGQPSTVYSKWFARFLDRVGLDDPSLVFHSFRHTAEDYFRTSQVPKYTIDQLIGHQDQSPSGAYGVGIGLEAASKIVASLKLPVRLPALLNRPKI